MIFRRNKGMVKTIAALLACFLWLNLAGCGSQPAADPTANTGPIGITLTDDFGRTVTLKETPQRLISLSPTHTETLFALGLADRVVGVTDYCDYPEAAKSKEKVGGFSTPNLEKIIALRPDLVIASDRHQQVVEGLSRAGVTVIALKPRTVSDALRNIEVIGRAAGVPVAAEELLQSIRQEIASVTDKVKDLPPEEKPVVYYEVWYEPLMTVGPGTVMDDLINLAGGINAAADAGKEYPEYSTEVLVKKNPQVMIHSYTHGSGEAAKPEAIMQRKGWKDLDCVVNKRIYLVDANLASRSGPRVGKGLKEFARAIHPELFVQ